jgi:hypothetical protein
MTTFTTQDRIDAGIEPIPFMGLVNIIDQEDREQMLRDQIHMLQAENRRLRKKLMEHGSND